MDIEFLFCGDTMLRAGCPEAKPFVGVRSHLAAADIAFCNLETAVSDGPAPAAKRHVVATSCRSLDSLVAAGFHIVNIANNHVLDCGEPACFGMIELLQAKGVSILGLEESGRAKPVVLTRHGVKVGFLGYADHGFRRRLMPLRPRIALEDVAKLKRQVDCVVVSLHWGFEYVEYPSPEQQRLARSLIDAGAHMVIGHHPHVVQGIEEYHGGVIAYSLGNFQFRINHVDEYLGSGSGVMLRVKRSAQGQLAFEPIPIRLTENSSVEVSFGKDSEERLKRLAQLSGVLTGKRVNRIKWMKEASRLWFPLQLEACSFRIRKFGAVHLLKMLGWLLRPANLVYLGFYLTGAKHDSTRALFQKQDR